MRLAALILIAATAAAPVFGQGRDELASHTGVSPSDVSVSDAGRIMIRGERLSLDAQRVLASEDVLILEDAVFSSPGRGRLILAEARGDAPALLGALLNLPLTADCAGEEGAISAPSAVMEADPDGTLSAPGPERLVASRVHIRLVRGHDCFGVASASTGEAVTGGPDGSTLSAVGVAFEGRPERRLILTSPVFASPEGAQAFKADKVSASYAQDDSSLRVSGALEGGEMVPARLLYPDLLSRVPLRDASSPMAVQGAFSYAVDAEGASLSFSAHADRVGSARFEARLSGDPNKEPAGAALISANGGFRDEGGFEIFRALRGESVAEAIRQGHGLPAVAASERFSEVREAVAGWVEGGKGEFTAQPAVPLNAVMAGASFLFGPPGLASAMNLETSPEFQEIKP